MQHTLIYIIGMPAAGKSAAGIVLSEQLGWRYADLDAVITARQGASPAQLIEQQGQPAFREAERQALATTFSWQKVVIATGGGAPCFFDNMQQMLAHGLVLWLDTPLPVIEQRLHHFGGQRPLLAGPEPLAEKLAALYEQRQPWYAQAHHRVPQASQLIDAVRQTATIS